MSSTKVRFLPCGDGALAVEFGNVIDRQVSEAVLALDERLRARALPGVVETLPTFRSLLIEFDPLALDPEALKQAVEAALSEGGGSGRPARRWVLPACYEPAYAPDLAEVAERSGVVPDEVVARHCGQDFHVYTIGFLPGFPYMGDLPEALALPRRAEPRVRVPAGSVAIATSLTAIYPVESPGGWHLIGRSPVPLFEPAAEPPALLAPGDKVRFQPVTAEVYVSLEAQARAGTYEPAFEWIES